MSVAETLDGVRMSAAAGGDGEGEGDGAGDGAGAGDEGDGDGVASLDPPPQPCSDSKGMISNAPSTKVVNLIATLHSPCGSAPG